MNTTKFALTAMGLALLAYGVATANPYLGAGGLVAVAGVVAHDESK